MYVVDGIWGSWLDWSSCSVSCDNGTQVRLRECDNPNPAHGGANCTGINQEDTWCYLRSCAGMSYSS